MSLQRREAHAARALLLVVLTAAGEGCSRVGAASLLPSIELGLRAQRRRTASSGAQNDAEQRWAAAGFVSLHFRPKNAAAQLPQRGELAPEAWIAPCDDDDVICLQDAVDAEPELADALGELQ